MEIIPWFSKKRIENKIITNPKRTKLINLKRIKTTQLTQFITSII